MWVVRTNYRVDAMPCASVEAIVRSEVAAGCVMPERKCAALSRARLAAGGERRALPAADIVGVQRAFRLRARLPIRLLLFRSTLYLSYKMSESF